MNQSKPASSLFKRFTRFFTESRILSMLLICLVLLFVFFQVADEVTENESMQLDDRILLMFRSQADLHDTIGPEWVETAFLDVTALGGTTNLIILTLVTLGFLWMAHRRRLFLLVLISVAGGQIFNSLLKHLYMRPRPSVVPHLTEVSTPSFPSGHSMMSAIVYLTLGVLLSRLVSRPAHRFYIVAVAITLTALIGISRVFLGVHYPSDVLAGWTVGLTWAIICLMVARILQHKGQVEPPEDETASQRDD